MKLKLIKNNEIVVNKDKYELGQLAADGQSKLINAINNGKVSYYVTYCGNKTIVKVTDGLSGFPIKVFKSDDAAYNTVCAEELVELLNQKQ